MIQRPACVAAWLVLAATLLAVAGCSPRLLQESAARQRVEIAATPFFPQSAHHCGPAALAAVLGAAGVDVDPLALTPEVYLPGRHGSLQAELLVAARRHGRIAYVIEPTLAALLAELEQQRPVLVLQNFGLASWPLWHYAVVIGYDRDRERVLLRSGRQRRAQVAAARFLGTWRRAGNWGFVTLRPGELPTGDEPPRLLAAVAAFEALGDHAAAALSCEAATRRWPQSPLAWFALGNSRLALGGKVAAEEAYREVLRLDRAQLAARNNLALLMARRGCRAAALATLDAAGPAAASDPLAAQLGDSRREIAAAADAGGAVEPRCAAVP